MTTTRNGNTVLKLEEERPESRPKTSKTRSYLAQVCSVLFFIAALSLFVALSTATASSKSPSSQSGTGTVVRGNGLEPVANLPTAFNLVSAKGNPSTDIGSWFNTNENQVNGISTGTNGHSWCGYPYNDSDVGFAISVLQMCGSAKCHYTDPGWRAATLTYCGLKAWVYNPQTGINTTAVILDAFAPQYLEDMNHTLGSIDATPSLFLKLGASPVDKRTVIFGVKWGFLPQRDLYYAAPYSS